MHDGRLGEAHLSELRRVVEGRAAVGEGALLPEEAVDAARQVLHVDHPREGLRLVLLEGKGEAAGLGMLAVAEVLHRLEDALERKGRRLGAAVAHERRRVLGQHVHRPRRRVHGRREVRQQHADRRVRNHVQ